MQLKYFSVTIFEADLFSERMNPGSSLFIDFLPETAVETAQNKGHVKLMHSMQLLLGMVIVVGLRWKCSG